MKNIFFFINKTIITYFIIVDISYVLLFILGLRSIINYFRRSPFAGTDLIAHSKFTMPITILVPAYNEAKTIAHSVKSLLEVNYPEFEVIVINDGSADNTLDVLTSEFLLFKVDKVYKKEIATEHINGVYISAVSPNLLVVDKANGGKADSLNAGLNYASYPLFCSIDADTILEGNALIRIVKPMLEDRELVASGGIVRVINGCKVINGHISSVRMTNNPFVNLQVVQYLRAFLAGRAGWSAINSILIISGAFGIFRKAAVLEAGGYRTHILGEDAELVVRLHRYMREHGRRYKILFITDPICWTEVPGSLRMLLRQRGRWHRGLFETLLIHRKIAFNPRYGRIGLLAVPYFIFFELLGPLFEIFGYVLIGISLTLGYLTSTGLVLFFIVSILFGTLISMGALFIEEFDFNRYERWRDIFKLGFYAFFENFGYRQLLSIWRIASLLSWSPRNSHWGYIKRKGFSEE